MLSIISIVFARKPPEFMIYRRKYSEILSHWGLWEKRSEILGSTSVQVSCDVNMKCVICRLPLRYISHSLI